MTYDPAFNRLTSLTDADGNTTNYGYDSQGNLLRFTYPNGTVQQFTYDPLGNLAETIDQEGDVIDYTYNSQGLLTQEAFADGTQVDFTYDDRGNMLTATDASGTITMQYDSAGDLTEISYPSGFSFISLTTPAGVGPRWSIRPASPSTTTMTRPADWPN